MPFAAFIIELLGVGADFFGGLSLTQWLGMAIAPSIGVGLWKVATEPVNTGQPQTAAQQAAGGVGSGIQGAGNALGGLGNFIAQNPWVAVGGLAAFALLMRR